MVPLPEALRQAFADRADGVGDDAGPLVGIFGEGVPVPLVAAMGALAVDVKAPPLSDAEGGPVSRIVSSVAEPFLDPFATRFLHRFAAGAFGRFATLIFCRDDVAGLTAYQYVQELRRQGRLPATGPRLHLWNLLHTDSAPAARFNETELTRLVTHLSETLGAPLDPDRLERAVAEEVARSEALALMPPGGPEAFVARNAGRWLSAARHRDLLGPLAQGSGPRIALVGTACDIPVLHEICAEAGEVVADLQDYGRPAPQPLRAPDLLRRIVQDPLAPRVSPPERLTHALQDRTAGADLVVASVDATDDSFGWEIPGLRRAVTDRGARFLDLGFRPFRPDGAWQDQARARIAEALA